jgi:hypothetical protein
MPSEEIVAAGGFGWDQVAKAAYELGVSHVGKGNSTEARSARQAHLKGLEDFLAGLEPSGAATPEDAKAAIKAFEDGYRKGLTGNAIGAQPTAGDDVPDQSESIASDAPSDSPETQDGPQKHSAIRRLFAAFGARIQAFAQTIKSWLPGERGGPDSPVSAASLAAPGSPASPGSSIAPGAAPTVGAPAVPGSVPTAVSPAATGRGSAPTTDRPVGPGSASVPVSPRMFASSAASGSPTAATNAYRLGSDHRLVQKIGRMPTPANNLFRQ